MRWLLVTASVVFTDSCHPDEGGAKFLRNVGSYRATRRNIPENAILQILFNVYIIHHYSSNGSGSLYAEAQG
jgi:hypothetical protein